MRLSRRSTLGFAVASLAALHPALARVTRAADVLFTDDPIGEPDPSNVIPDDPTRGAVKWCLDSGCCASVRPPRQQNDGDIFGKVEMLDGGCDLAVGLAINGSYNSGFTKKWPGASAPGVYKSKLLDPPTVNNQYQTVGILCRGSNFCRSARSEARTYRDN